MAESAPYLTEGGAEVTEADKRSLYLLGERLATIAALPKQKDTVSKWCALNGLKPVKPMVWIDDIPWHEMDVEGQLRLQTTSAWSRYHEWEMRKLIYLWEHMPGDMVVEPAVYSPLVVHSTGFGMKEDADILRTDQANLIVSRHYNTQIHNEEDLERIKVPVITHDSAASTGSLRFWRRSSTGSSRSKSSGPTGSALLLSPGTTSALGGGYRRS